MHDGPTRRLRSPATDIPDRRDRDTVGHLGGTGTRAVRSYALPVGEKSATESEESIVVSLVNESPSGRSKLAGAFRAWAGDGDLRVLFTPVGGRFDEG